MSSNISNKFPKNLVIVIPAKATQETLDKTIASFYENVPEADYPKALVVVDNNSNPPLKIDEKFQDRGLTIELLAEETVGPAAARNTGWRHGALQHNSELTLFIDCGCEFTKDTIGGYKSVLSEEILAYQGKIEGKTKDWLSHFYDDTMRTLVPLLTSTDEQGVTCPGYIVTANTMVKTSALEMTGGFNEIFPTAAGEDVDLGMRLARLGKLAFADDSITKHAWLEHSGNEVLGQDVKTLASRYERYGKGNAYLARLYPQYEEIIRPKPPGEEASEVVTKVALLADTEPSPHFSEDELKLLIKASLSQGYETQMAKLKAESYAKKIGASQKTSFALRR